MFYPNSGKKKEGRVGNENEERRKKIRKVRVTQVQYTHLLPVLWSSLPLALMEGGG